MGLFFPSDPIVHGQRAKGLPRYQELLERDCKEVGVHGHAEHIAAFIPFRMVWAWATRCFLPAYWCCSRSAFWAGFWSARRSPA